MHPNSFYEVVITLILKPDKNTHRKSYRQIGMMNIDTQFLNKLLENQRAKEEEKRKHT